jgi:hypothetical protein
MTELKKVAFFCPDDILAFIERGKSPTFKKWSSTTDAIRSMLKQYILEHPLEIPM